MKLRLLNRRFLKVGGSMAQWGNITNSIEPAGQIRVGGGLNTYTTAFDIDKSQQEYSTNLSSILYPSLSVRKAVDTLYYTEAIAFTMTGAIGSYNDTYLTICESTKYWRLYYNPLDATSYFTISSGLSNPYATILEFNTLTTRYSFAADGTARLLWDGSTSQAVTVTDAPATSIYTVDDSRLYALDGSIIKYSAVGIPTDWTTAMDAGYKPIVGMKGTGTAIIAYNNVIVAWGSQSMHIMTGNAPDDFEIGEPIMVGNISHKGTIQHTSNAGNILYWIDYGRVMAFSGGTPYEIGQPIKKYLDAIDLDSTHLISAGKSGKYIYWSIPVTGFPSDHYTLEYDTEFNIWNVWDLAFSGFANLGEKIYAITPALTGVYRPIIQLNTTNSNDYASKSSMETAIYWEFASGIWSHEPARSKKTISEICSIMDIPVENSTISTLNNVAVYYSTTINGFNGYQVLDTIYSDAKPQDVKIRVPRNYMQRLDWYRLLMSGYGRSIIHYIEPYLRINKR